MFANPINAIKSYARYCWSCSHKWSVPKPVWAVFLVAVFVALASHLALAVSFIVRVLFVYDLLDPPGMGQMMHPWESHLAWAPLLAAGFMWLVVVGFRARHENREFGKKFFEDNESTPLSRAAFSQKKPRPEEEFFPPTILCMIAVLMARCAFEFPDKGLEFLPTLAVSVLVFSGTLTPPACWLFLKFKKLRNTPRSAYPAFFRPALNRVSAKAQFETLPEHVRKDLTAQAIRLGIDPGSSDFMRTAMSEYRQRIGKAMTQAKKLDRKTPAAAPVSEQDARSRRF